MAVALSPIGGAGAQFFDNNGNPLSGGKLYTYEAGTTTPAATYTTLAGTTAHTNPIILDSAGRVPGGEIWLTLPDFYKFVLKTSTEVTIGTWDNIQGYSSGSVAYAATEVQTATAGQTLFVLNSMFYNPGTNTLAVFIDGVNQVVNNSYVESTPTSVTFMSGLHVGAVVKFVNVNVASADASAVSYEPGGAGAVQTTVQAKLRETVSVKDFGAVGDGSDESAKFQAALNAAVGKILFVPKPQSKYVVTGLLIPSNVIIEGEGYDTIIEMKSDANATARMFLINGLTGQPKSNIAVRNLHFKGTVVADGFSEFRHLFYMWGASNITVENNWFTGWQGDALDVVWTPGTEGNENITIQNNVFDGVNNDNRNAISVIGCDKLLIDNNIFKNCTRSNMPGAIDIEPNSGYTFIKLNAVTISNNRFENIGGNVGAMAMFLPVFSEDFVEHPKNITIENNTFSDVFRGIHCTQLQSANVNDSDPVINLQIINNKVDTASDRAFWLYGLNGVVMENNTYENCANGSRIGWSDTNRGCNNIRLRNNTFKENGTTDGYAIQSYQSNRVQFYENTFIDCGVTAGGFGVCINFVTASVSNIRIIDNSVVNPAGKTTAAVSKTGGITVSYDQNILQMNNFAGLYDLATSAPQWFSGTGSPQGVVTAPIGSLYVNVSGGAGTTLYVKESGAFATGWVAK